MKQTRRTIRAASMSLVTILAVSGRASVMSTYFDVTQAPDHATFLEASYTPGAQSAVMTTQLFSHNVLPAYSSNLEGGGDFLFGGWGVKDLPVRYDSYLEFDVKAISDLKLKSLSYTWFGGLWSYMGGTRGVIVNASRDGFVSDNTHLRGNGWNVELTTPFITDCPNDFVDDLSTMNTLKSGQTMSFRFYGVFADYSGIPSGFWNKSPNDYNPTLSFEAVPEPCTITFGAAALILAMKRRQRKA